MGQALYRKYRSKSLSEIVGQEHITKALTKALETGRISHAYLFTGPRGIGKTSIARILAYEVNDLPYDESATHIDIIEIDAASNRRIDEIRDLREKVHIAPTATKYKVYIIDEVHMLTREAFNALLKTLEEPPAHVIFVLATTEAYKLPETIISRTQHFTFKPIEENKVAEHLKTIAEAEKIAIADDALALIAKHGGGSFRDSISLLDQMQHTAENITADDVRTMLGIAPEETVTTIWDFISNKDVKNLVIALRQLKVQGIEPPMFASQLAAHIRTRLVENNSSEPVRDLALLEKLVNIPSASDPYTMLEITLLGVVFDQTSVSAPAASPKKTIDTPKQPAQNVKKPPQPSPPAPVEKTSKPESTVTSDTLSSEESTNKDKSPITSPSSDTPLDAAVWAAVLTNIKQHYNTLYGVLRMAQPEFTDATLVLRLKFAFHQKRLNEPKNRQVIADAIHTVCGATPEIICTIEEADTTQPNDKPNASEQSAHESANPIGNISNIFGGAEVLES